MTSPECECKVDDKPWLVSYDTGSLKKTSEYRLCCKCESDDTGVFSKFRLSKKKITGVN
jgi:hypothetical protein